MATTFRSVLDNAFTTTAEALDDSELGIDVTDGSVFPLTVDCPCILTIEPNTANMEKVLITANAANVLTVDASGRGYEGSVAKAHASGVKIELLYVATNITELQTAVNALENGAVYKTLFDAQSILAATTDDTPAALTVAEQTLVGRITAGNIAALTPAQVMAMLSGQAAADFAMNTHKITGVVDPTADQEAATKKYVDDTVQGSYLAVATIENPAADDAFFMFFTFDAISVSEISATRVGGTSVTFGINHSTTSATAIAGTGNEVFTGAAGEEVLTSDETWNEDPDNEFDDYTIPADSYVALVITAVSGTVTQFHVTVKYTKD